MANLSDTNALLENLPPENRAAITGLIDQKMEVDMQQVIAEIRNLKSGIRNVQSEFKSDIRNVQAELKSEIKNVQTYLERRMDRQDARLELLESSIQRVNDTLKAKQDRQLAYLTVLFFLAIVFDNWASIITKLSGG